uniref:Uncharacterized protein n=1 Tax=viral metagenome TaxID=1070528 RepID=A0A6M3LEM4_9ZZZZ
MIVEIDFSADKRTPNQNRIVAECRAGANLLCKHGYRAKAVLYMVNKPGECPAAIVMENGEEGKDG